MAGCFGAGFGAPGLAALRRVLLYVHVPFCATRCSYCNFAVDLRTDETIHARYVQAVVDQLDRLHSALPDDCTVPGIDIGGGTPTLLAPALLARLTAALGRWRGRCETPSPLSIETTPSIAALQPERLATLRLAEWTESRWASRAQQTRRWSG